MKFILVPMGSAGDVHPLVWLARLLQARGHDVVMIVQAIVADMARRAGVRYISVGNEDEQAAILKNPDLWHPQKAFPLIAHHMPLYAREMMPAIETELSPSQPTIMIAGSIAFAPRILSDRHNIPLLTAHLQPMTLMSAVDMPVMLAGAEWLTRMPHWLRRAVIGLGHRRVDNILGRPLAQLRREMGEKTATARGTFREWAHSTDGVLCLFPEWYARKASDWPPQSVTTRFPLYDEGLVMEPDTQLEQFLAAGDPPVVATPGSANAQAASFLKQSADACIAAGKRCVLVTRFPEQVPANLPPTIRNFDYVPFGRVFPRAAAVLHHGGIGTTAQCLAAGVPQLIMPMAHDQPDNANRIKTMGVGDFLYPRHFKAAKIAEKIHQLTTSPSVKSACIQHRDLIEGQMTEPAMAELIERMSERALNVRKIR